MHYRDTPRHYVTILAATLGFATGLAKAQSPGDSLVRAIAPNVVAVDVPRVEAAVRRELGDEAPSASLVASAAAARMDAERLRDAVDAVRAQVRAGAFPGGVIAAGRGEQVALAEGVGREGWSAATRRVDPARTVYDVASLTKVVGTTTAVMLLVEDGKMSLDAKVSKYLPEFAGGGKERVTVRQLLTHTAGFPAGMGLWGTPEQAWKQVLAAPLKRAPGEKAEYSDLSMVVLWRAAERAAGEPLFSLLDRRVYGPLKMRSTTFLPGEGCPRCAPTAKRADGTVVRGVVHDPTARKLGGIAGNAGLFSTAHDLARFAAMLANGGELDGVRVLREETIDLFARRQPGAGTRALGWDTPGPGGSGGAGTGISKLAYGHTGFTGTSLWIDPVRETWTVLLANRTYAEDRPNRMQALRRAVNDRVALAADAGQAAAEGEAALAD